MRQTAVMAYLGYTRISTAGQDDQLQRDALTAAGVQARDIYSDVTSGSKEAKSRPGMQKLVSYAQNGDTIVVWRIDRLGRSLLDVLTPGHALRGQGVVGRPLAS